MRMKILTNATRRSTLKQLVESRYSSDYNISWDLTGIGAWLRNELVCGNKMPTRCNRGFYCRSYRLFNMFRAPLCPSSGAQEWLLPVVFRVLVFKLLVWCGAKGYVSGVQDAAASCRLMMGIVVPETC